MNPLISLKVEIFSRDLISSWSSGSLSYTISEPISGLVESFSSSELILKSPRQTECYGSNSKNRKKNSNLCSGERARLFLPGNESSPFGTSKTQSIV